MNFSRLLVSPILSALVVTSSGVAQVQDYRELKYPALPDFKIPKPATFTLNNGLQVFLLEDHELPLITVTARIRTGSNYEPAEKAGLASLMGSVQRSGGTARQTGDQLDDFLAARAATIETGVGDDSGSATMNCLKQDFDDVFKVFNEVLRTPAFAQDKLEVAKVSANTMVSRRNDDIGEITGREIRRIVYGQDSPLARQQEYATIRAVSRDDLEAWHKEYYHPNNILLGVVGDFAPQEMKRKIEAMFGDWPKGQTRTSSPASFRKDPAPGFYFIEKSDVNQANIVFGHLGIETKNPDYFAVQVMNEILGGGFSSRMFSNVRSKQGLAYSVYGNLGSDFLQPGLFRAGLQTKLANTSKAIVAVRAEIAGIIENPVTAAELKRAKDSILNSFIFNYDSKERVLSQQMTYAFYGLPENFLEQYRANIEKVQAADVTRVAKKYVHPDQLSILVVGKASELDQPLSNSGKVATVDITIPPPPDAAPQVEKSAEKLAAGKKVWGEVAKTYGGEGVKRLTAFHTKATVALSMSGQSISLQQSSTVVFPDKSRQVISSPMGEQIVVTKGDESFLVMAGKVQPMPEAAARELRKDHARTLMFLLRYHDAPSLEPVLVGSERVGDVECRVIAVSFKGAESRLWVAPDGKVLKQSYQGTHPLTRAPGTVDNLFADYRVQGGLLVAYKMTRLVDGQEVMQATMESFEADPQVEPTLFDKPAN